MLARLSLVCVIFCFHHHANNSASTRAAQWPAPSPDMTGLVAAGANPLSKGRVPAQSVVLDYSYELLASLPQSFFISCIFTCRRSCFSVTPLSGCSRLFSFCVPVSICSCLSCTPILLRYCLTCFFQYTCISLDPTNNPSLESLQVLDLSQPSLSYDVFATRLSSSHEPSVSREFHSQNPPTRVYSRCSSVIRSQASIVLEGSLQTMKPTCLAENVASSSRSPIRVASHASAARVGASTPIPTYALAAAAGIKHGTMKPNLSR
jgi:hypothetical protein